MTDYVIIDAACRVLRVEHSDKALADLELEAGASAAEVTWTGWPAAPSEGLALAYRNGLFVWDDPRTLADAQADQMGALQACYESAISVPVTFTAADGTTATYQADADSRQKLSDTMQGCQGAQQTPVGFFWVTLENSFVPFSYADLQGLAAAFFAQGAPAFAQLQALKVSVRGASTLDAVRSITWPAP